MAYCMLTGGPFEAKEYAWHARDDVANSFFSVPLAEEVIHQFAST